MLILLTAIPVTFSIAIVKYNLLDIYFIVNRSVVYTIIIGCIFLGYILFSATITLFVENINPLSASLVTALLVAVFLQPVKTRVQKFVDKKFFRLEYNFREVQKKFLEDIKNSFDIQSLADKIVQETDILIPVDKIGFFLLTPSDSRLKVISTRGWEILVGRSLKFEAEKLKTDLSKPVALDKKVEPGTDIEAADIKVFKRWGMVLVFPVKSPSGLIHAFLVLGSKKAGTVYYKDDIDLLNTVTFSAALAIDKIKLQEELISEQLEAERLKELNSLKSFFVSSLTHDLKSPLSSIKIFTELLMANKNLPENKKNGYLLLIDTENDKLRRMIENVLDFAKIEKGLQYYDRKNMSINPLIEKVFRDFENLFKLENILLKLNLQTGGIKVCGDAAALERALSNLLTNALKYSPPGTSVIISTSLIGISLYITIKDEGIGIAVDEVNNIFRPFFRAGNNLNYDGTGLGLSIVSHIVEAHSGRIEVSSCPGKGTEISIVLPVVEE